MQSNFAHLFQELSGTPPFPWQNALYSKFVCGEFPSSANIPTGLGKTSIVAIWLVALALYPERMPRRLVYVVNRRTVVDQTTDEVKRLRIALANPELAEIRQKLASLCALPLPTPDAPPLALSTLRGEFADNGEWCADPARPAVIVGTVDMIGSGLLFSRYTRGFKTRPLHAGFLAQDALLVHDEAHLEPAFQTLLSSIVSEQKRNTDLRRLRVIELTATSRGVNASANAKPFSLDEDPNDKDTNNEIVKKRFNAAKRLSLVALGDGEKLDAKIVSLAEKKDSNRAVLVFTRSVETAVKIAAELDKGERKGKVATLTGTLRGKERDELVKCKIFQHFLPPSSRSGDVAPAADTVYLVATSAGEVGVNLSATDLVCDLSTYESMAQRFGRVNRFGENADSTITVVYPRDIQAKYDEGLTKAKNAPKDAKKVKAYEEKNKIALSLLRTLELLRRLAALNHGIGDASPAALDGLPAADRTAAFSPLPKMRVATTIQFDAWALTSIREPLAARPSVAPYLHGETEWEPPETHVAWREETERLTGNALEAYPPEELLEDFPLKPGELLRDASGRVFDQLVKIARSLAEGELNKLNGWLVLEEGKVEIFPLRSLLSDNTEDGSGTNEGDTEDEEDEGNNAGTDATASKDAAKRRKDRIVARLADRTLILPPSFGGLTRHGFLAPTNAENAADRDNLDVSTDSNTSDRKREWSDTPEIPSALSTGFRLVRVVDTQLGQEDSSDVESSPDNGEDVESDTMSKVRRYWLWLESKKTLSGERRYSSRTGVPETLAVHTKAVVGHARAIAEKLFVRPQDSSAASEPDLGRCLILAAQYHDLGKNRRQWQLSIGNVDYDSTNPETIFAKCGGKLRSRLLAEHYRHEFGSLADITSGVSAKAPAFAEVGSLSNLERDIVLHLVAAHHGRARPHFPTDEVFDYHSPDPRQSSILAMEIPRRFARLQRRFGRWGLAWIESLLRAADYAASAGVVPSAIEQENQDTDVRNLMNDAVAGQTALPSTTLAVNPANPGHYFACCGLFELASRLAIHNDPVAPVLAWFEQDPANRKWRFHLANTSSLASILNKIVSAGITALEPTDSTASPLEIGFPFNVRLDWWKTSTRHTAALKVWAGTMECPRIARAMQGAVQGYCASGDSVHEDLLFDSRIAYDRDNPDNKVEPFYFDSNRGPNAHSRDVGFAANDLKLETLASPAVELLALVGLQRATPAPALNMPRNFDYRLWTHPIPVSLVPAAVNGLLPDQSGEIFRFESWFRTGQRKHKAFLTARTASLH